MSMTDKDVYIEKLERDLREARRDTELSQAETTCARDIGRYWRDACCVGWLVAIAMLLCRILWWRPHP